MLRFDSDYNNGAHPDVLQHLIDTNDFKSISYGFDQWSNSARKKICDCIGCPDARVEFLVGGTQTNATVIDSMLASGDGVIAVNSGHIAVHEAGAIETSGHKIITLPEHNGKMASADLQAYIERLMADETREHMVQPGMVYITFPTELGTIYSASEIDAIYKVCQAYELPLFVDGARLGYGLMAKECDFDINWFAHHCDAFYIGGTKVGALCGEAVVFPKGNAPRNFFTSIKRHGALLAKGRLVGVQFEALFTDNLYFRISLHAIEMAHRLKDVLSKAGFHLYNDSPTNQLFVVIPNERLEFLHQRIIFESWEPIDETKTLCRFVTSWATKPEDLDQLEEVLRCI